MRVLDRYIVWTVVGASAMVMAVLLTLLALFLFIGEQSDVGTGNYGSPQALHFVLLNLPTQLFQFLPIAALLGALLGMGALAGCAYEPGAAPAASTPSIGAPPDPGSMTVHMNGSVNSGVSITR